MLIKWSTEKSWKHWTERPNFPELKKDGQDHAHARLLTPVTMVATILSMATPWLANLDFGSVLVSPEKRGASVLTRMLVPGAGILSQNDCTRDTCEAFVSQAGVFPSGNWLLKASRTVTRQNFRQRLRVRFSGQGNQLEDLWSPSTDTSFVRGALDLLLRPSCMRRKNASAIISSSLSM